MARPEPLRPFPSPVLCRNSSGHYSGFSSKVWLCSRVPEATPGKDLTGDTGREVWYRPRVGCSRVQAQQL